MAWNDFLKSTQGQGGPTSILDYGINTLANKFNTAGFSWPFGRNQGLESNRLYGIDAPMNYQDQIRNIPNATWRGYTDRIMDDDLMVNQQRREALEDIDTNPLYDDTGVYTKEPGEKLFAENWTPSDLLNPFRKGDENIFGYQKRPGQDFNFGIGNLFQRNPQMEKQESSAVSDITSMKLEIKSILK